MDVWKVLAGLGVFLFGMAVLEKSLKNLVGKKLKQFLKKNTNRPVKGIFGGMFVTIVLQSSSMVTLMLLAFVEAGILKLKAAVGIIFGTNLGTTFTGWLFVLLGFSFGIDQLTFLLLALGGLLSIILAKFEKLRDVGMFLLGFGFLFLGLEFMKTSIGSYTNAFDPSLLGSLNPVFIFAAGLVGTAIIQSSSAMMAIVLSALHAGFIPIETGAVMMIGSDLGTTITVVLGAIGGSAVKKRVALAHVLFNVFTVFVAVLFLYPILFVATDILKLESPLLILVFFHSGFNLMGVIFMLPFTGALTRFLEARFLKQTQVTKYIGTVPPDVPELALEALRLEVSKLVVRVVDLNTYALNIETPSNHDETNGKRDSIFKVDVYPENYAQLKTLEGKMVDYYLRIQNGQLNDDESRLLNCYIYCIRNAMESAKNYKGILLNIKELENSSNDAKRNLCFILRELEQEFYTTIYQTYISSVADVSTKRQQLELYHEKNQIIYDQFLKQVYREIQNKNLSDLEISTLLNVNRESHHANEMLIEAMKDVISPTVLSEALEEDQTTEETHR